MQQSTYSIVLAGLWLGWLAFWLVSSLNAKVTVRRESLSSRMLHVLPMFVAAALMASRRIPIHWLYGRFLLPNTVAALSGVAVTAVGLAFAIWARVHLG